MLRRHVELTDPYVIRCSSIATVPTVTPLRTMRKKRFAIALSYLTFGSLISPISTGVSEPLERANPTRRTGLPAHLPPEPKRWLEQDRARVGELALPPRATGRVRDERL